MGVGLQFRDVLSPDIVAEFDNVLPKIGGQLDAQHNPDGSHGDITVASVSLQGAMVGEVVNLPYSSTRYGDASGVQTWTVLESGQTYLRASQVGQIVFVQFYAAGDLSGNVNQLQIALPEFNAFPNIDGSGFPISNGTGNLWWISSVGSGHGIVRPIPINFTGPQPQTTLRLTNVADGTFTDVWDAATGLSIAGSVWFVLNPDNAANTFYGI